MGRTGSRAGHRGTTTARPGGSLASPATVAELGETGLLAVITPLLPASPVQMVGNGDDCAVLAAPDGRYVVSTDVLVEGHHFRTDWSGPEQVGRRAAAQNLADAAAMGARSVALVVSLVLPGDTPVSWVEGLARGLGEECRKAGAGVVGGDLSAGESIVIAVTVHGDLEGREPVLRSGARAGDLVVHAGDLGLSAAGLALLEAGAAPGCHGGCEAPWTEDGDRAARLGGGAGAGAKEAGLIRRCVERFLAPAPPIQAGPALAETGAHAMMDVSDSLLRDCGRIAAASGVVVDLDDPEDPRTVLGRAAAALEPVAQVVLEARGQGEPGGAARLARQWVLTGGEDHGMLACVPADAILPEGVRVIGRVLEVGEPTGQSAPGVLVGGRPWTGALGWDHFAG